jgi:uncharacterized membrane protein YeaQ/YmgE (transglycosylase-associated protein family)
MGFIIVILIVVGAIWLATKAVGLLIGLLIAGLTGYLASRVMGGDGAGPIGNVVLGLFGGVVGNVVLGLIGADFVGGIWIIGSILVGIVGAVVIILIARALGFKAFAQ